MYFVYLNLCNIIDGYVGCPYHNNYYISKLTSSPYQSTFKWGGGGLARLSSQFHCICCHYPDEITRV